MLNKKKSDVIISGAGVAGLTLALLLSKAGLTSTLIDPMKKPNAKQLKLPKVNEDIGTRTTALMNDNMNILDQAGISDDIAAYIEDLRELRIIDAGQRKDKSITFLSGEIGLERFGANIPNIVLSKTLVQHALKDKNITIIYDSEIESYEAQTSAVNVTLNNGKTLNATLLIGADGRKSKVRELAMIDTQDKDSGQIALTCILKAQKHHSYESTELHYQGGPFTLVPLPDNYVSLVWVEKADRAKYWLDQNHANQQDEINALSKNLLGELELKSDIESYPLISLQASEVIKPRIALIAEAAHVLHPMGAQGLNTSLRDVAIVKDEIINAASCGLDFGGDITLRKYRDARHADASTRNKFSFGLNQMVANDSKSLKLLRRFGLETLKQHSVLRHAIMRYGLAPYNDKKQA